VSRFCVTHALPATQPGFLHRYVASKVVLPVLLYCDTILQVGGRRNAEFEGFIFVGSSCRISFCWVAYIKGLYCQRRMHVAYQAHQGAEYPASIFCAALTNKTSVTFKVNDEKLEQLALLKNIMPKDYGIPLKT